MSAIIFDFDGTIADTIDFFKDFLVREAQLPPLSAVERQALHGMTLMAMARHLGHPWWRLTRLYFQGRTKMSPVIGEIQPFVGMPKVIKKLHAEGHQLFIVSSNSKHNMQDFLRLQHLDGYFVDIFGGAVLFDKRRALGRLLRKHQLDASNTICVGDEVRDVRGAKSVNLRVIAVSWGFAHAADLHAAQPTGFAATPAELLQQLEEI